MCNPDVTKGHSNRLWSWNRRWSRKFTSHLALVTCSMVVLTNIVCSWLTPRLQIRNLLGPRSEAPPPRQRVRPRCCSVVSSSHKLAIRAGRQLVGKNLQVSWNLCAAGECPGKKSMVWMMKHHIAPPQAWNQLPADISNTATYSTFKRHLKTYLFSVGYGL